VQDQLKILARNAVERLAGDSRVLLTIATNVLVLACSIGPAVLAARALGPEGRGELAAALVWSSLLSAVVQLGLAQSLTYCAAAGAHPPPELLSAAVLMVAAEGVTLLAVTWSLLPRIGSARPELVGSLAIAMPLVPLLVTSTYACAILQGLARFTAWNTTRAIAALAYPFGLLLAIVTGTRDVHRILYSILAATSVSTGVILAVSVRIAGRPARPSVSTISGLLRYGLRAHWGNLAWLLNTRLDQLVLSLLVPFSSLGQYAIGASMASGLLPFSGAFASVTFTEVASALPHQQRRTIVRAVRRTVLVTGLIAGGLVVTASWVVPTVFGDAFVPGIGPARILLLSGVVLGINYVLSDGLRGLNHPARVAACEAAGLLVTSLLLWTLVPRLGVLGAALASLGAVCAISCLLFLQVRRSLPSGSNPSTAQRLR
jgi:O-antigen/teichoic acid export membrane protein